MKIKINLNNAISEKAILQTFGEALGYNNPSSFNISIIFDFEIDACSFLS